ncbi:MAG: aldehyde dehydrogenase family protein, partial [Ilumatobacteraceae bacterium]
MSSSSGDTFRNFIGGEWCDSADGRTSPVVDPATGEEYARAAVSGPADVDRAMSAAEAAFETWRDTTPSERALALLRIADAVEAHGDELMSIESKN